MLVNENNVPLCECIADDAFVKRMLVFVDLQSRLYEDISLPERNVVA